MYIHVDEDFAINGIHPKFLCLLLTDKIRIGMTERGSSKNSCKRSISSFSKVVHNIQLTFAYSEFTVLMQNQL